MNKKIEKLELKIKELEINYEQLHYSYRQIIDRYDQLSKLAAEETNRADKAEKELSNLLTPS